MTDVEEPVEEEAPVAEEPVVEEPAPAVEEPAEEEAPAEEPVASGRVRWVDDQGNEFFAGPGETVPDNAEPA